MKHDHFLVVSLSPNLTSPKRAHGGVHFDLSLTARFETPDQVAGFLWGRDVKGWLVVYVREDQQFVVTGTSDLNALKAKLETMQTLRYPAQA